MDCYGDKIVTNSFQNEIQVGSFGQTYEKLTQGLNKVGESFRVKFSFDGSKIFTGGFLGILYQQDLKSNEIKQIEICPKTLISSIFP